MTRFSPGMTSRVLSRSPFPVFRGGMKEEEIDIHAISQSHVRRIDKFYRMCAGLSSELVSFRSGVIELEIRKSGRWPKSPEVTARQLAED